MDTPLERPGSFNQIQSVGSQLSTMELSTPPVKPTVIMVTDVHTIAMKMKEDFDLCKRKLELYLALKLSLADSINMPKDHFTFCTVMLTKWIAESSSECPPTVDRLVSTLTSLQMNAFADWMLDLERDGHLGGTPRPTQSLNLGIVTPEALSSASNQDSVNTRTGVCFGLVQPQLDVIGRDIVFSKLHTCVTRNAGSEKKIPITSQLTCVWGLGGVGKTTLVRKYAWDSCDYFDGNVIWIKADDEQNIQNSFENLASSGRINIQLDDWNKREANMTKIFEFFSNKKSLFVFDNVEKYTGVVDKFLPLTLGTNINKPYVLMTSRKEGLDEKIEDFKLGVPSFDDMTKLMTTKLKLQTDADISMAYSIVGQLQGLPLAIQQSISYIHNLVKRKQKFARIINPIQEYLTLLQDNSKIRTILDSGTADDYEETVLRTWTTTMKTISQDETYGSSAERIMNILAYFNNDSINCDILESVYSTETSENSLMLLTEYSMVELDDGIISIHRLVQQVIRIWNNTIDPELLKELLKDCLEILTKRPDTLEHSYTIWKSALNYNDLVQNYPRVGKRLCENVHLGSDDSIKIFQDTSNKFNEVFGPYGTHTLELDCIKIISLCHDMSEPNYNSILQLNDQLIDRLRYHSLDSIFDIVPTLYRLAGSLLKIGKSSPCPREKREEIITHSLKHYERIQEAEEIKSSPGVNAQIGIDECRQIQSEIRRQEVIEMHLKLKIELQLVNIVGPSGVGKTTLAMKYVQDYGDQYNGVIWINADTKESMELSILKISDRFDDINLHSWLDIIKLCPDETHGHGSNSFHELELQLRNLASKLTQEKYLVIICRSQVDVGIVRGIEGHEHYLLCLYEELLRKMFGILILSTETLDFKSPYYTIYLYAFRPDEAIKLIRGSIPLVDNELAGLLAEKLHHFPLALHYATQYLITQMRDSKSIEGDCGIKEYLELFEQYSAEFQDKSHHSDKYEHTIEVVWNITKRKIEEENAGHEAIKIMKIIKLRDPANPTDLSFDDCIGCNTIDGLRILDEYGLLRPTNYNTYRYVRIHPLLQKIIQKQELG